MYMRVKMLRLRNVWLEYELVTERMEMGEMMMSMWLRMCVCVMSMCGDVDAKMIEFGR